MYMSCILYYSNFCSPSKKLIYDLGRSKIKEDIHFICIDNREKDPEKNSTNIVLPNGQKILLPPTVIKVPAMLLLYQGHRVLFGKDIYAHSKT